MVSSLVIGSEAAVIIDLPLTISSAESLILWVREKTDKYVVALFASHNHPDHYLSARACLDAFPEATFYASPKTSEGITIGAPLTVGSIFLFNSAYWTSIHGSSEIVQNASVPIPYNFTFFALPGDSEHPIHLIQPLTGDTVDETLFWLPSSRTLITGDTVYGSQMHLFMADMLTPALTASWISTLDLLLGLNPETVIPGHSLSNASFSGAGDLDYTRKYLAFWQCEIESKGADFYTPPELYNLLDERFPGRLNATSQFLLNVTAENFGRGGTRFGHFIDFTAFDKREILDGWEL
ncbi:metallo-beta-lactamase domain protein [Colletotrichum tofieldiae]|uniref:Metallo-beta-lactamase domain protein n=1 Tax=Colletotrichum tofieldiae TaxID=708197 RepID=A0A161VP96_9PEZI|nr:metallo-beta-lactamase domain protein [Colletotrichum tofieldiae]